MSVFARGGPAVAAVVAPADASQRDRARLLVEASRGDPLAPFALRVGKSYFWSPDSAAFVAYRVRLGTAVISGDPVGDHARFAELARQFIAFAEREGWRVAVLGAGDVMLPLWQGHGFGALSIGRDVVIDVDRFSLQGRQFRNLRQAVQRSHNSGVTVTIQSESEIGPELSAQLLALRVRTHKASDRGFSMLLGNLLDGIHSGSLIAVARDRGGRVVAFQRYLRAGSRGLSLDLPVRDPEAPNGVDERLAVDVVRWAQGHGIDWVSLAFAPFADLHTAGRRTARQRAGYRAMHLLDPLIRVGSLYTFLSKFHALGGQRHVVLRWRQVVRVATAMLLLEFESDHDPASAAPAPRPRVRRRRDRLGE